MMLEMMIVGLGNCSISSTTIRRQGRKGIITHDTELTHAGEPIHPLDRQRTQVLSTLVRAFCVRMILGGGPKHSSLSEGSR